MGTEEKKWGEDEVFYDIHDPELPFFEVYVGGEKAAELFSPAYAEMFWCSYLVVPINEEWDTRLRANEVWNEGTLVAKAVGSDDSGTSVLAGEFTLKRFLDRQGDRIDFRSLWPPGNRIIAPPSMWQRLLAKFRRR